MTRDEALAWLVARTEREGSCLIWTCAVNSGGMPIASIEKVRGVNVRRWVVENCHGKFIRPGRRVMPTCGDPRCLSEEHLRQKTAKEVSAQISKQNGGRRSPQAVAAYTARSRAKSTVVGSIERAREIRQMRAEGMLLREISETTGISMSVVHLICAGKAWREGGANSSVFSLLRNA